jgi:hypothetical protein
MKLALTVAMLIALGVTAHAQQGFGQRDLTPEEKKVITDAVAPSLRNPGSATYHWAKFPALVAQKRRRQLGPGIRRTHVNNADRFQPRLGRLHAEQLGLFAALNTAPEFSLGGEDEMLIERIGMSQDLHPLTAAGDHREDCRLARSPPVHDINRSR